MIMKKFIFSFVCMAIAAIGFSSCTIEDTKPIEGSYQYFVPNMEWGASASKVTFAMGKMSGWKRDKASDSSSDEICFIHKATKAEMRYRFNKGKLEESSVSYYGCNDKFDQMKSDWAGKWNLVWTEETSSGFTFFVSENVENDIEVIAQRNTSSSLDYMSITVTKYHFFLEN